MRAAGLVRTTAILSLAALGILATADVASARARHRVVHRHHMAHVIPHRFVFATPRDAREDVEAAETLTTGPVGDYGIDGATTADPYQHPAVGYDLTGRYGPGFVYPN